jgi:uncharacterized protein
MTTPLPQHSFQEIGPSILSGKRSFSLKSGIVDQEFVIDVAAPITPQAAGQRWPVVYVLDANGTFGMAAQTARLLQLARALPPLVMVGVGYRLGSPTDTLGKLFGLRTRDFAPTVDVRYVAQGRAAPPPFTHPADLQPGQAHKFLAFITEELKPFVESLFPVDPADQSLLGISLGGLFVLHVLFTSPTSFSRYLAGSPSIWWDDGVVLREEAELAIKDLNVRLFISAGALEEADAPAYRPVSNVQELAARLSSRSFEGLKMTCHVFPEETHASVVPATLSRGLRTLYSHRELPI